MVGGKMLEKSNTRVGTAEKGGKGLIMLGEGYQWIKEIINGSMELFIYQCFPIIPLYWSGLKDCQKSRDIGAYVWVN